MEILAQNIAENRKRLALTQKELGEKLNVTAQAVSKWEKGDSEPDAASISQMCKIFGVTADELLGNVPESAAISAAPTPAAAPASDESQAPAPAADESQAPAPASAPTPAPEIKIINGYCESCKKPVGPNEYEVVHYSHRVGRSSTSSQHIYCKACHARMQRSTAEAELSEQRKFNKLGVAIGILGGLAALGIILAICLKILKLPVGQSVGVSIAGGIAYFAFAMQMFWDGAVREIFSFSFHSFNLPGVIFTLDLDGIFFLIAVKIIGSILCGILSVLIFIFVGLIFTPLSALFILPFSAIKRAKETKVMKDAYDKADAAYKRYLKEDVKNELKA